jgi:hypothetical protein
MLDAGFLEGSSSSVSSSGTGSVSDSCSVSGPSNLSVRQSSPVDEAVKNIEDSLTTDFANADTTVSHDDLKQVTVVFLSLDADQTAEVIDRLVQDDMLDTMADLMVNGSGDYLNGGTALDSSELSDYFDDMAAKLDGAHLKTLSDSFAKTDLGSNGIYAVSNLGEAVARSAPGDVKVAFIQEMAGSTTDNPTFVSNSNLFAGDAEALAVAHVLGSLGSSEMAYMNNNPANCLQPGVCLEFSSINNTGLIEEAFASLSPQQLDAVMTASVVKVDSYIPTNVITLAVPTGPSVSINTELTGQILTTASEISDQGVQSIGITDTSAADIKSNVFVRGADLLQTINKVVDDNGGMVIGNQAAMDTIVNGMASIIDSDTNGIMTKLSTNYDVSGEAISVYTKQMFNLDEQGQTKLGEQLARLQYGNDMDGDAKAIFDHQPSSTDSSSTIEDSYVNAKNIGYFVGGVYNGARSAVSGNSKMAKILTSVIKTAIDLSPSPTVLKAAKNWMSISINPNLDMAQQMELYVLPRDSSNNVVANAFAISEMRGEITSIRRLGE